ncbi:hypothetical protein, partial [Streptomyces sp. NPDC048341]|uniref:hypothetical protein n=1 Tax=Streptomyces sp. NPDC048341 TaxID=3154620 RepID=UPI00342A3E2F
QPRPFMIAVVVTLRGPGTESDPEPRFKARRQPPWMRKRQAGMRLRAYGILCIYALMLVNGIPRIADASNETVTVCMNVGFGFGAAAAVLLLLSARKDSSARTAGPVEPREG